MAAAILKLPENSATEVLLVYKYTKAESVASLETATDVSLEVRMTFLSFFFPLKNEFDSLFNGWNQKNKITKQKYNNK